MQIGGITKRRRDGDGDDKGVPRKSEKGTTPENEETRGNLKNKENRHL